MRRIFASSNGRLSCGALSSVSHLCSCVSSSSVGAHSPATLTSTTHILRMAARFQSRGRINSAGAHVDVHIKAATTMATPSSFALINACGVAHDVMVGQIGDDAIIQFTLVSHIIDPVEAEQRYVQINAPPPSQEAVNENNNSGESSIGSSSSSGGGRVNEATTVVSPARGLRSVLGGGGGNNRTTAASNNNNNSLNGNSIGSSGAGKSTSRQQQRSPAVDEDHNPFSKLEAEKAYAIAKQQHLHQSSTKEQFTVRCFGGEEELLALQSRLSNGDFVKVEGNLKVNKQKDLAASSGPSSRGRSSAPAASTSQQSGGGGGPFLPNGERCFPYIRIELGDEDILKAASRHLAITEATPRDAPRRHSRMGPLKGTHALVKSGNVTIVSRTTSR